MRDLRLVRPTVMCAVPRFFERVYHGILDQIDKKPWWLKSLISYGLVIGRAYHTYKRRKRRIPLRIRAQYFIYRKIFFKKMQLAVGGNLRFFISGGAALSKPIAYFFEIIGVSILEGYGLTETSPVVAVNSEATNKIGTVGAPLHNVEVAIESDGEIIVRGPSIMKGYFKDDTSTAQVMRDGWLYTGDIGKLDRKGFLKIIDRKKDIIVLSGGKNISPKKIENMLIADKLFNQVVVFGDERKYLIALIVPDKDQISLYAKHHSITHNCIDDLVEDHGIYQLFKERIAALSKELAAYERVKRFRLLHNEFTVESGELTATFKMRRKIIYANNKHIIDKLYS